MSLLLRNMMCLNINMQDIFEFFEVAKSIK